jgi:hypothetical protein
MTHKKHLLGAEKHLFVGTQDLCVQSNQTGSNKTTLPSGWKCWIGHCIGLDAKILRPYKKMIRLPDEQMFRLS